MSEERADANYLAKEGAQRPTGRFDSGAHRALHHPWEIGSFPWLCECGTVTWYRPEEIAKPCACGLLGDGTDEASRWWQALAASVRKRIEEDAVRA